MKLGLGNLRETLRYRMIVIALAVHLGIWLIAVLASSVTAVTVILDSVDDELEAQIEFLEFSSDTFIAFVESLDLPIDEEMGLRSISVTEQIGWSGNPMIYWTKDGSLVYRTANSPDFAGPTAPGFADETIMHDDEETNWRVLYKPVRNTFWIAVGVDTRETRQEIIQVGIKALYPMVLIIPLTVVGIYLGTTRGLRPMEKLAVALQERSPTSLDPVGTEGIHREMRPVVDSLNGLLEKLALALENEHRFTANAAHELQTPLTAIKAELQMHQRSVSDPALLKILDSIASRVDRAVYTVRQLLTMARLESHDAQLPFATVDLHTLTERSLADHGHLVVERGLELWFPEGEQWPVRGHTETLSVLIGNLLANAFRYTPDGGSVLVEARGSGDGLVYTVANDCAAMTEEERQLLVDRFYRKPGTYSAGAGLGLSIVQRIAEVHHAELALADWKNDQGLRVTVTFPS